MDKNAVIEILKYLLECDYVDSFEDTEKEALRIAIKVLEQGPETEPKMESEGEK